MITLEGARQRAYRTPSAGWMIIGPDCERVAQLALSCHDDSSEEFCGANISGARSCESAQSVSPAALAVRIARAVGAEAETMAEKPAAIAFCAISKEQRLVTRQNPFARSKPPRNPAQMSLSRALCRPTSSRTVRIRPSELTHAAACAQRVRRLSG